MATPVQAQEGQPDRREVVTQLQQLIRQLRPIRQQAMQDSGLQARRDSVVNLIRERMKGQSDTTASRVEELQALEADMRSARQASDTTRMKELQGELRRLSQSLSRALKQAMQSPQVQQRLMEFQEAVRATMREIDPAAEDLLSRADSLRGLLRGQGGGGGGPGG